MTHEQAHKLLDHVRHGIAICATFDGCMSLLRDALTLLEDDRRRLREVGLDPLRQRVPTIEEAEA